MDCQLVRVSKEPSCVRGVLLIDWEPICVTLECPWLDNKMGESCIPDGTYSCFKRTATAAQTGTLGWTWEIDEVPDRDGILIHVGNFVSEIRGCILVGTGYDSQPHGNIPMITESRKAFHKFFQFMKEQQEFELQVMDIHKRCQVMTTPLFKMPLEKRKPGRPAKAAHASM